jgi:hypothetical protein
LRFSLFAPDGSFLRQHVVPVTSYGFIWRGMVDARGRVNDPIFVGPPRGGRQSRMRRVPPADAPVDTVDIPCGQSELPGAAWHAKSEKGFAVT